MKLLFAHDFPMIRDTIGNVYSKGAFPYAVWERYLKHFDKMTILGRERERINYNDTSKEIINSLSVSSGPDTNFIGLPNLSSIKGKVINKRNAKLIIDRELKKSDALIARLPSEIGKLAITVAIDHGIPYLIELVGCPYDAYRFYGDFKGNVYAPISMYQTKKIVKNSQYTIYVTKEYLQERYPTKGDQVNISNVNINDINNEDILNTRINSIKTIGDRKLKIGMIGSLNSKYKGFDKAIEYISKLANFNDYEIHILGAGDENNFKEIIRETGMTSKVFFDGTRSSGEEVFKWLDGIDLFIHPSLTEGLPRALIEALSRGCLAIGSTRGGIPELLEEKYLFNPLDEKSFNRSIKNALHSVKSMEEQIYINLNKVKEYTIPQLSQKRDNFIRKFISENKLKL
ncbi:glycosyltransferase [Halobacillus shinanisalinarum]|uniref:Glycosyltransferase n=1 Tax=Halobacillus shinanisalinarum TaxID=2932258 RepID=A0ABY4H4C6_9BACI|nr:glycosyltransferase [Halobacillus shinanisalinarum]UOQ95061.1 glycosyltransferase [Halobacillus shinanisalinarum]